MRKLLLIDDSFTARAIVERVLGPEYSLKYQSNGRDAIDSIKTDPPDLILLDLLMPEMDGFAVLKELRDTKCSIPVLVLSADIQNSTRDRVKELGAFDIINKPPRPDTLRKAVEDAITGTRT